MEEDPSKAFLAQSIKLMSIQGWACLSRKSWIRLTSEFIINLRKKARQLTTGLNQSEEDGKGEFWLMLKAACYFLRNASLRSRLGARQGRHRFGGRRERPGNGEKAGKEGLFLKCVSKSKLTWFKSKLYHLVAVCSLANYLNSLILSPLLYGGREY